MLNTTLDRLKNAKVLMYSHDSFGLGHLRRCRVIAHSLVDQYKGLSVLIISGSPIIGQFDFKARVNFITVPSVVKLRNGDYTSLALHVDIAETMEMRKSIIQQAAETFKPDIFIVDKEPLGLRGEVETTLLWQQQRGGINVLGLRDVMDDSEALQNEWQRKNVLPALESLYHEIWVYGSESIGNPIQGIEISTQAQKKMKYLGYLKRSMPSAGQIANRYKNRQYLLVTPGGGGDGALLIDWVLRAYESNPDSDDELLQSIVMLGPFMSNSAQKQFRSRARKIQKVHIEVFDNQIELLMMNAQGIVAMGGYNTFCEILSFDKKAILVPRETPRLEQKIRADYAVERNLVGVLRYQDCEDSALMLQALKQLPNQPVPSSQSSDKLLTGLNSINNRVAEMLSDK